MADTSAKFDRIMEMVEMGNYFTINRPRQYGKTTMLFQLTAALRKMDEYLVFRISFEGVGDAVFENETAFAPMFFRRLMLYAQNTDADLAAYLNDASKNMDSMETLSTGVSALVQHCQKKIVLLIDEVDKSSNNQLFISFLGILRDKYLARSEQPTFHSVILTGVHDVKTLKIKISPNSERKLNSPWNIAADFKVDMNLYPKEIEPMLKEYAHDRAVQIDCNAIAQHIFYYTSGHPFLVSKLCKIFDEELLPQKTEKTWTVEDVDTAARQLIGEGSTNFDEIIKNLENNRDLYQLVQTLILNEEDLPFNRHEPTINIGIVYGIFTDRNNRLAIHNRIYREMISNYMTVSLLIQEKRLPRTESAQTYLLPGNHWDIKKALRKFQELMRAEYSKKDRDFLERQGRLIFLAFLKPILNGHGNAFKEPQISEERRLDLLIAYYQHRYLIELKLWHGPAAHQKGLDQLADYLEALGLDEGALLIFDHSKTKKQWKEENIEHKGKRIFAIWT